MSIVTSFKQRFEILKQKWEQDIHSVYPEDFYYLLDEIDYEKSHITDRVFEHPKYNCKESPEVPESIELGKIERLEEFISNFTEQNFNTNNDGTLEMMFPDGYDEW